MREPRITDIVDMVCRLQPELDDNAVLGLLALDLDLALNLAEAWKLTRSLAEQLLALHLALEQDRVVA